MSQKTTQIWQDTSKPASERIDALLSTMTFDDKVNLVMGNTDPLVDLGIPSLERVDASCGLRGDTGVTAFPSATALSATFNSDLAYEYGAAIGKESREHGWSIILGPTVDVERRGNSGRIAEGYGEDPLLNGIIGEAVARGMMDQDIIPCIKHFTAYNQEIDRNTVDITVSQRALYEIYNAPFFRLIEAGVAPSIMGAYPKVNGTYACENADIFDDLRAETGWQGFTMSDFKAGDDPLAGFNHAMDSTTLYPDFPSEAFSDGRISETRLNEATRRTLFAIFDSGLFDNPVGKLDQHKPVSTAEHKAIAQQVAEQSIVVLKNHDNILPLSKDSQTKIAVIGCAREDVITGVEGSSYVDPGDFITPLDAIQSIVSDESQVQFVQGTHGDHPLPVIPESAFTTPDGASNGLLGTFYANPNFEGDTVAEQVFPTLDFSSTPIESLPPAWSARWEGKITSPTAGLINFSVLCTGSVRVFIDGTCIINGHRDVSYFILEGSYFPLHGSIELTAGQAVDIVIELSTPLFPLDFVMGKHLHLGWQIEQLIPQTIEVVAQLDSAIVFVNQSTGEGMDRDSFELPSDQNQLIEAVAEANPNTIVVLNTPGSVIMPWLDKVAAVLQVWYPGEVIGTAIASVLFGDTDPGGRLPITFPTTEQQTIPPYDGSGQITFDEDIFVGYRYFQKHNHEPLFPFGYGLSYTSFEYSDLRTTALSDKKNIATLTITVTNTGERAGTDVVQVYVGELPVDIPTPKRQLAGFAKVELAPDEQTTVEIMIPRRVVSYWDESVKAWAKYKGRITLFVCRSSGELELTDSLNEQKNSAYI